jgi:hypothetical protein
VTTRAVQWRSITCSKQSVDLTRVFMRCRVQTELCQVKSNEGEEVIDDDSEQDDVENKFH